MEAILRVLHTGPGWPDLPAAFGSWQTAYACFQTRMRNGLRQAGRDNEHLLVDCTVVRVHAHGAGPADGQLAQAMKRSKVSLSTKIHLACEARGFSPDYCQRLGL